MSGMPYRVTRSHSRQAESEDGSQAPVTITTVEEPVFTLRPRMIALRESISRERKLTSHLKRMERSDASLLLLKQSKLKHLESQVPTFIRDCLISKEEAATQLSQAAAATLVFAQEAAGTAVCISPEGLLLTCSHCIAASVDEYDAESDIWLLFASGDVVKAKCIAWDPRRDLALLQVTIAFDSPASFPYVRVSAARPKSRASLICIGHPGSEDFEAEEPGTATGYDVLHISHGRFLGLAKGQDPQDNNEIGALMHDCWTYWGHSGAPLIEKTSGKLVGVHSSWDDQTAMRRGVAWEALNAFLEEHTVHERLENLQAHLPR